MFKANKCGTVETKNVSCQSDLFKLQVSGVFIIDCFENFVSNLESSLWHSFTANHLVNNKFADQSKFLNNKLEPQVEETENVKIPEKNKNKNRKALSGYLFL